MEKAEKKALYRKMYRCMNAFWLCSFLGLFGAHRFYVGKIGTGLLQLFTLGGLFIWWSIDLYKIIRERFTDKKGDVLKWYVPEPIEGQHNFAGFRIRLTALLIDSYILLAVILPITIPLGIYAFVNGYDPVAGHMKPSFKAPGGDLETFDNINSFLNYIVGFIYSIYFHASRYQATLGKRAVGIYVVSSDGLGLSYLNAFGRYLATFLSYITLCIGFIMAGWTKKKRALHDIIAGTYVVYGKAEDAIIRP
jgi:uncharacterized RDD family membrane protein YckC